MTSIAADAVLFDLDGTLVDSDAGIRAAWSAFAKRRGLDPDEVLGDVPGRTASAILTALGLRGEDLAREVTRLTDQQLALSLDTKALPGSRAILSALSPDRWAVVTAGPRAVALARLMGAGLPAPDILIAAEDVRASKPDPEGFVLGARRLGAAPGRCVVFEDSAAGARAGLAAEATVIAIGPDAAIPGTVVTPNLEAIRVSSHRDGIEIEVLS